MTEQAENIETISKEPRQLTQREINDSQELFDLFDSDGAGMIYTDVLGLALRALGWVLSEADVRRLQAEHIVNGNNTLDFADFLKVLSHRPVRAADGERQLRDAFTSFDQDGTGYISLQQLRHMMTQMGEALTDEQVDEMLMDMVPNGDGHVSYEEMVQMMK